MISFRQVLIWCWPGVCLTALLSTVQKFRCDHGIVSGAVCPPELADIQMLSLVIIMLVVLLVNLLQCLAAVHSREPEKPPKVVGLSGDPELPPPVGLSGPQPQT